MKRSTKDFVKMHESIYKYANGIRTLLRTFSKIGLLALKASMLLKSSLMPLVTFLWITVLRKSSSDKLLSDAGGCAIIGIFVLLLLVPFNMMPNVTSASSIMILALNRRAKFIKVHMYIGTSEKEKENEEGQRGSKEGGSSGTSERREQQLRRETRKRRRVRGRYRGSEKEMKNRLVSVLADTCNEYRSMPKEAANQQISNSCAGAKYGFLDSLRSWRLWKSTWALRTFLPFAY